MDLPNRTFIKCTYAECDRQFTEDDLMIRHKIEEHDYCHKCKVDYADWEAFHQHKVDAMKPWLDGIVTDPTLKPKHITCEFCDVDFKSFGGRRIHLKDRHQADQNITCAGCGMTFTRASGLTGHLERGHCPAISRREFIQNIQQKHIVKQLMQDPGKLMENLEVTRKGKDTIKQADSCDDSDSSSDSGSDSGSVEERGTILQEDEETNSRHKNEKWPRLPAEMPNMPKPQGPDVAASSANTDGSATSVNDPIVSSSRLSTQPSAWTNVDTATELFPDAIAATVSSDIREDHDIAPVDNSSNLLYCRFWDPSDKQYQPDMFFNIITQKYFCPFPQCDRPEFECLDDIHVHVRLAHIKKKFECPGCHRIYTSASALISHSETTGARCMVQKSAYFMKLIDDFSGGFLKAQAVEQPLLYRPETAVEHNGHRFRGFTRFSFTAKMPLDR